MRFFSLLFALLTFSCGTRSQTQTRANSLPEDPYFILTTDTVVNHGPRNITRNILQDRNGTIWLASWEGVIKYDGNVFTNITLKENQHKFHMFSILEQKNGTLWFGSIRGGAYRYDGKHYQYFTSKDGLVDNIIVHMMEDKDGNIWFATDGGVSRYDGKKFVNFSMENGLTGNSVNWIMQDRTGKIWIATRTGVSIYDGKTFTNFNFNEKIPFYNVRTIIEDKRGVVWIGGSDGLVKHQDGINETIAGNFVGYIYEDRTGKLWISASDEGGKPGISKSSSGMSLYQLKGKNLEVIMNKIVPGDSQVFGILEDNDGNILVGTMRGVCRLMKLKSEDKNVENWSPCTPW